MEIRGSVCLCVLEGFELEREITPLRSSADKHLPRWPNTVRGESQVVIWICVSAGNKHERCIRQWPTERKKKHRGRVSKGKRKGCFTVDAWDYLKMSCVHILSEADIIRWSFESVCNMANVYKYCTSDGPIYQPTYLNDTINTAPCREHQASSGSFFLWWPN